MNENKTVRAERRTTTGSEKPRYGRRKEMMAVLKIREMVE